MHSSPKNATNYCSNTPDITISISARLWLLYSLFLGTILTILPPNIGSNLYAQQQQSSGPYQLSWKTDLPLVLGGGAGMGTSFALGKKKPALSTEQINALKAEDVWRIDRFATRNWSIPAQKTSDYCMFGAMVLPLALLADAPIRKDWHEVGTIAFETYLLTAALTGLSKNAIHRNRPFLYNPNVSMDKKLDPDANRSFFSGHTSMTAAATFMTAKIYSDYHPHSKWNPYIWTTAAAIPALTAYLRVKGGKHYLSDVLIGYLVGAGMGILVPELHKIGHD